jgi:putative spermidine/putrescine transport system substrate-binding protein
MQRRIGRVVSTALIVTVAAGLAVSGARSEEGGRIVVSSWGGAFTKATAESFVIPFSEEKGITYQMVDASGQHLAQVRAQQAARKVTWDIIDSLDESTAALMFERGLLEKIPADVKKVLEENSAPGMVTDYGVMQSSIASPYICNKEKVKACPQDTAEFFDVDRFPGDRSSYNDPYDMLVMALHAVGVGDSAPTVRLPVASAGSTKVGDDVHLFVPVDRMRLVSDG